MPKLRFWIAALAVICAGLLAGPMSCPVSLVATASCWHPSLAGNIGIAEQGCD